MAGHSKWHNIQHRKNAQDKKRGKLFTKLIREITVAAKLGGGDPDSNPRLRDAIAKALGCNMTKDTIKRAVTRGAGGGEGSDMIEIRYEGYGPAGVAVIVDCLTDNKNRTVAEVRHAFTKCGGNLGTSGSVEYLFTKQGIITFNQGDEEKLFEIALENGGDDVIANDDGSIDIMTAPEAMLDVKAALEQAELKPDHAEVTYIASTEVSLDLNKAEKMIRLTDMLEDCDDVQNVYSNANISDDVLAQLDNL
jgi:YebC/PmpR family DNA-binding regulatory protein